jgi:hypothetical protein
MAALKIALVGAPCAGALEFASVLDHAVKASAGATRVLVSAGMPARPADLAGFDLVLLMGLEPTAHSRISLTREDLTQEVSDQSIRAALADAGLAYQVLYGASDERLAHALRAIESLLPCASPRRSASSDSAKNRPWVWVCDKCSDPQCEHRLLTALLAQRPRMV